MTLQEPADHHMTPKDWKLFVWTLVSIVISVGVILAFALAYSSSGPTQSYKDGFYWAKSNARSIGLGNARPNEACASWATYALGNGDDRAQWEAGCAAQIEGDSQP